MRIRTLEAWDRQWLRQLVADAWSLPVVTPAGVYDDPTDFDGVVAEVDGERTGAVTYRPGDDGWEVVTVNATVSRRGVGTAMMRDVFDRARAAAVPRVWLITTDENPRAIAFYTRLGMRQARTHENFVDVVAAAKPAVRGAFRDAIEFEWLPAR